MTQLLTTAAIESGFLRSPLLRDLSRRRRQALARLATGRVYPEGSVIIRQGDTSVAAYLVLSGSVRVESGTGAERRVLGVLAAGELFGEMGALDDQPRSATVVALERTECALLSRWDVASVLRADPAFAIALIGVLNRRLRSLGNGAADAP